MPGHFDPDWYLQVYPDVAAAGLDPRRHYLRWGRAEGRLPCFLTAKTRERDLRRGLLQGGRAALEAQTTSAHAPDRLWATLACARADARAGNWAGADAWLRPLDAQADLIGGFCLPDIALLAIEAAVIADDLPRAQSLFQRARAAFGPLPDLHLAAANIAAATGGFGAGWRWRMARLYARHGLGGVAVTDGTGPAFDRLRAAWPRARHRNGPLVSVVMPARNAATTIQTALSSLTGQSWRNLEILVVDNGSTDATADITRACAAQDPRIRLLDGRAEPGTYAARNLGMAAAQGDFLTVLDADDWAHPARIARQVRALRRNPDGVASLADWVRTTPEMRFTRWWGEDGLTHPDVSSLMIRAELRETLGYWDRARAGADTEYINRIRAICGDGAILRVNPGLPLSFGRLHAGSLTQNSATGIDTQIAGARRDYDMAGRRWHRYGRDTLPLAQYPAQRPFPIPPALSPDFGSNLGDLPAIPAPDDWVTQSGLYDDDWYMQTYPDLRAGDLDGALQYRDTGAAQGRDPGPGFSTSGYAMANGPLDRPALQHYVETGRAAGHDPLPLFDGALPAPEPGRHVLVFGHQARAQIFGAERCLPDLLRRARAVGLTPSVVLPQIANADYLAELRALSHKVHVIPYGWSFGGVPPHPETLATLTTLIRDSGAVEIHQNTIVMDAPLLAARAAGVPTVVHVHELPASDPRLCLDLGRHPEELRAHVTGLATRLVANSDAVLRWLDQPPGRAVLAPAGVDAALADLPFEPADPPRVALIGSLTAKKGIADFCAVARHCPQAQFLLIGPDNSELAQLAPLPPNVTHTGYAPGPAAALAQADIVLSLSHVAESFGLSVMEALCAGRPVLCYDRGTPPDLVGRDQTAGRVTPADDPPAMAQALRDLLKSPETLTRISHAARARGAVLQARAATTDDTALFCCAPGPG